MRWLLAAAIALSPIVAHAGLLMAPTTASAPTVTTWDPTHYASTCSALSSGNTVATATTILQDCPVYATSGQSSGKWFFEVDLSCAGDECTVNPPYGVDPAAGVANTSSGVTADVDYLGGTDGTYSFGYYYSGALYVNGSNIGSLAAYTLPVQICVAYDLTNHLIWFEPIGSSQWNNDVIGNQSPTATLGGKAMNAALYASNVVAAANLRSATSPGPAADIAAIVTGASACAGVAGLTGFTALP